MDQASELASQPAKPARGTQWLCIKQQAGREEGKKNRVQKDHGRERHQTCMELTCQPNKKKKNHPNEMSTTLGRRNILLQMQKNLWQRSLATRKKGAKQASK
jgi:hypothetical protein